MQLISCALAVFEAEPWMPRSRLLLIGGIITAGLTILLIGVVVGRRRR